MDDEEKRARERLEEKIVKSIRNKLNDGFCEYFSYAWREKVDEMLKEESRYSKLVKWLDKEIEETVSLINVFCPADRSEDYTNDYFRTYKELMQNLAIMIHCRELLLDERTTTKMRENIEYTVCKLFNIHFSEFLNNYV